MQRSLERFVASLWVLAVAATLQLSMLQPSIDGDSARAALWFAGLGLIGHLLTFTKLGSAPIGTVAYLPYVTAVVIFPHWLTVLYVGLVSLVGEVFARRPPIKFLFNLAQSMLTVACAAIAARMIGLGNGLDVGGATFLEALPRIAVTAVVFLNVNWIALAIVLSLSTNSRLLPTWKSIAVDSLVSDAISIPFVFVFAKVHTAFGGTGVSLLAVPLVGMRQLHSTNWQLKRTNEELLELMVAAIEARDPYTSGHSRRVAQYSRDIALGMGLPPKKVDEVARAALLHDVGKIDEKYAPLLRKPTRLTAEEEAIMQTHAARSAELVAKVSNLKSIVAPVRHHHEAWDGTGYPDGLAGERIPLAARIIAFADTIDAMTSERPYRGALSEDVVRAELVKCRGSQFDPALTDQVLSQVVWKRLFPEKTQAAAEPALGLSLIRSRERVRA